MNTYIIKHSSKLRGRTIESLYLYELKDYYEYLRGFSKVGTDSIKNEIKILKQELKIRELRVIS